MNTKENLVIVKGEDKTEKIHYFEKKNGKISIKFNGNRKMYTYNQWQIEFFDDSYMYEIEDETHLSNGKIILNVDFALQFDEYIKIFYKDRTTELITEDDIVTSLYDQQISEKTFFCFKEIAKAVSIKTDDGRQLLSEEYNEIKNIDSSTVLYDYLYSKKSTAYHDYSTLIFPFGSNKSQKQAVKNALSNKISVIEGPPGTGKTQTILNIIANILVRNKTVAVLSNNNSATENVHEKMKAKGLGDTCAFLGNSKNKEKFIASQTGTYELKECNSSDYNTLTYIQNINKSLDEMFDLENYIAQTEQTLSEYQTQFKYLENESGIEVAADQYIKKNCTPESLLKLKTELEYKESKSLSFSLWDKVRYIWLNRTVKREFFELNIDDQIKLLNRMYYALKIFNLNKNVKERKIKLKNIKKQDGLNRLTALSVNYLKSYLSSKYNLELNSSRRIFNRNDLKYKSEEFVKEYPVVFSTTYSIKKCLNKDFVYDYVIIDEASQVDLITGALAFSCAKNVVVIGDRKQLPNVISDEAKAVVKEIGKMYKTCECYDFNHESLLTSVIKAIKGVPRVLLKEHYRCHPKIINFANKKFYNNELIVLTKDNNENDVLKVTVTPEGNHARGKYNERQVNVITDEVLKELNENIKQEDIGIVSPYNTQKESIIEAVGKDNIMVDTVHKYQGREKEAIIITTVDNDINEFVDDPKLLNVAVTRAKRYLRLIVSKSIASSNSNIGDLVKYIKYNNFEVEESKIKSIYDLLYKANREEKQKYLKDKKLISQYDSENITYNVLQEVLSENKFDSLDVVTFVPLKDIINDFSFLTEEERRYALNRNTHLDFVIYSKMDKKPVLIVEVDGYKYHKKGSEQNKRDIKKDNILKKYGLALLRLSTVGNNEKDRIKEMLDKCLR